MWELESEEELGLFTPWPMHKEGKQLRYLDHREIHECLCPLEKRLCNCISHVDECIIVAYGMILRCAQYVYGLFEVCETNM